MNEKAFSFLLLIAVTVVGVAALADLSAGRAWPGLRVGLLLLGVGVALLLLRAWRHRAAAWELRPDEDVDGSS